jgi:ribosomal protein S27AE
MFDNLTLTEEICPLCGEYLMVDEHGNKECNRTDCPYTDVMITYQEEI